MLKWVSNCRTEFCLMIPLMLIFSISEAQVTLDPGTTAVRFVYSREIDRKNHGWIEEQVFDEWFDEEVPKICHICDNVYRYPVDNGSLVTRGLRSMINRKKIAEILEVREFLMVLVASINMIGGNSRTEVLSLNQPRDT